MTDFERYAHSKTEAEDDHEQKPSSAQGQTQGESSPASAESGRLRRKHQRSEETAHEHHRGEVSKSEEP